MRRALLLSLALLACAASAAHAAPRWMDDVTQYTQGTNCASVIMGSPYREAILGAQAGTFADPADLPGLGEVFYVRVVVAGLGHPCAGPYAHVELQLPGDMQLGISEQFPVQCLVVDQQTKQWRPWRSDGPGDACPQQPRNGHNGGMTFDMAAQPWPMPQGQILQIAVPVYATKAMKGIAGSRVQGCGDCATWIVQAIDGEGSPSVNARTYLNTGASPQPGEGLHTPDHEVVDGNRAVKVKTTLYNYFRPLGATVILRNRTTNGPWTAVPVQQTTDKDYARTFDVTWNGLVAGHQYEWRLAYCTRLDCSPGGEEFIGATEHLFTAPGGATGVGPAPQTQTQGAGTIPPKAAPPSTQTPPPSGSAMATGTGHFAAGNPANVPLPPPATQDDPPPVDSGPDVRGGGDKPPVATSTVQWPKALARGKRSSVVPVQCDAACAVTAKVTVDRRTAKRLRLKRTTVMTAKGSLSGAGRVQLRLNPPKALPRRTSLKVAVTVTLSGQKPVTTRRTLKVG